MGTLGGWKTLPNYRPVKVETACYLFSPETWEIRVIWRHGGPNWINARDEAGITAHRIQTGNHGAGVYYVGVAGGVAASAQRLCGQDSGVYAVQPKGFCRFARVVERGVVNLKPLCIGVNFAPAAREYQGRAHLRKLLENVMSRELAGTREIDRLRRQVASLRVAAGVLARDAFLGDTSGWGEAPPGHWRRVRRVLETRHWGADF